MWQSGALYSTFLTCILAFHRVFSLSWHILVSNLFITQNLSKIQPLTLSVADFFAFVRHFVLSDMPYKGNAIDQRVCFPDRHPTVQKLIKRPPEVFYDCVVCPQEFQSATLKLAEALAHSSGGCDFHQKVPERQVQSLKIQPYQNHIEIISKS